MAKKRHRNLSEPEKLLWERVVQTVTPLIKPEQIRIRAKRLEKHAPVPILPSAPHPNSTSNSNHNQRPPVERPLADRAMLEQLISGKPLSNSEPQNTPARHHPAQTSSPERPIEPRLRKRITRGREEISQTIDLHGLRQDEARHALINFLNYAQKSGARTVLVITGKGKSNKRAFAAMGEPIGDGVLRQMVPQWLHQMPSLVSGVSSADRHHGGSGALYVRLRRTNSGRRP